MFLLKGEMGDRAILTDYKTKQVSESEIAESALEHGVLDMINSGDFVMRYGRLEQKMDDHEEYVPPKSLRIEPTRSKFDRMCEAFAGGKLETCRVNTDNTFEHKGRKYKISKDLEQYQPKQT